MDSTKNLMKNNLNSLDIYETLNETKLDTNYADCADYTDYTDRHMDQEHVDNFINNNLFVYIIVLCLTYIPEFIVIFTKSYINYKESLPIIRIWIIISIFVFCAVVIIAYIIKDYLIKKNISILLVTTFFFIASLVSVFTFISLYSYKLALCYSIILTTGLVYFFIVDQIETLKTKYWIKMTILFIMISVLLFLYIGLVNQHYVEFFVLIVVSLLYFNYVNSQLKQVLYEYWQDYKFNYRNLPFRLYLTTLVLTPSDIMLCSFK
jgi:hypothetical protein